MSTSPSPFGQNEWLVEEMYRKFREDPSSVDPSWHEFLVDYSPEPTTGATTSATSGGNGRPTPAPAPAAEAKTEVKAEIKTEAPPSGNGKPTPAPKAAAPAPVRKEPAPSPEPAKAAPTAKAPAPVPASDGDEVAVLRGAAAAVVKNMNASLDVPTATSVRAIPAKLMIDNRVVINNHLKRTRGGKISFTHLLGYAIVAAVKKFPNMNSHFAEIDGKPNVVTPAHTNLGLAIDLQGKDGKRQLVVAAITPMITAKKMP